MSYFLLILALALSAFGAVMLVTQFISIFSRAPYVPSDDARVKSMIELAGLKPGERVVDFGSGDGRIVLAAARAGAVAVGWEMNPLLVFRSRIKARLAGLQSLATFRWGSYVQRDFHDVDVVFTYLLPSEMKRIEAWLSESVRPGTRIVVNAFPFPSWTPEAKNGTIYRYKMP